MANNTTHGCEISGCGTHIYITVLVLLAFISTLANLVVMIAICKNKGLRRPALVLLAVLSTIHFLAGCIITPIKASIALKYNEKLFIAFEVLFTIAVICSFSTILLITFDRLLHVYYLHNYKVTNKKLCSALVCLWIILFLLTYFVEGVVALVYFILGISAMVGAYIGMIITLRIHNMNTLNNELDQDMMKNQQRAVRTTLIVVVTFLIMNIPSMIAVVHEFDYLFSPSLCALMFVAFLLNATFNPFIYYMSIPVMKKNMYSMFNMDDEGNYGETGVYLEREDEKRAPIAAIVNTEAIAEEMREKHVHEEIVSEDSVVPEPEKGEKGEKGDGTTGNVDENIPGYKWLFD